MSVNSNYTAMQDELLIRYLAGEASAEDMKKVDDWRKADPACEKRFGDFKILWEASSRLLAPVEDDAAEALVRFRQKVARRKRLRKTKTLSRWSAVAACLLLFAGAVWFYLDAQHPQQLRLITTTKTNSKRLPDGSVITLNRNSSVEYPRIFQKDLRQVILTKGEAFFKVSPNKAKPFIITTGTTTIRVVGTSFNVKNRHGQVEVIVETGLVEVRNGNSVVFLKRGERTVAGGPTAALIKGRVPDKLYTYYRSKVFEAQDTPLWRMVEVLNDAYDSHIVIGRKELYNLPLNATFKDESLEEILYVISKTFSLKVERNGETILLK